MAVAGRVGDGVTVSRDVGDGVAVLLTPGDGDGRNRAVGVARTGLGVAVNRVRDGEGDGVGDVDAAIVVAAGERVAKGVEETLDDGVVAGRRVNQKTAPTNNTSAAAPNHRDKRPGAGRQARSPSPPISKFLGSNTSGRACDNAVSNADN